MELINGDCLEKMKDISNNSIDFLFCDLPYGQTSCKWDCVIDLELFWREINRICKIDCPMFFTCTTKFGVSLINSNPKNFRYDLVWVKSASCGFLNAKKMPMKKHEMIYVFYRKLPLYDISSHEHKYLNSKTENIIKTEVYSNKNKNEPRELYRNNGQQQYDPPLPNSVIRNTPKLEECFGKEYLKNKPNYREINPNLGANGTDSHIYDPPLPHSLLEIKSEKGKHATQKPVELIKYLLKYYSKEGDVVLDPTMGSGSTGLACKEMNRHFIGIEKDEKIFKVAKERLA